MRCDVTDTSLPWAAMLQYKTPPRGMKKKIVWTSNHGQATLQSQFFLLFRALGATLLQEMVWNT